MEKRELNNASEWAYHHHLWHKQDDAALLRLGFGTIDAQIRGLAAGQILGIAARSSVGKTFLLESIEHNLCAQEGVGILSLSLEMPGTEWFERAVAIHYNISGREVERRFKANEFDLSDFLAHRRNSLWCEQGLRVEEIPSVLAQARAKLPVPLRVVLIDYFGLLEVGGRDAYERSSTIAKALKRIVKAEHVAFIVAMQLSRAGGDGTIPVTMEMVRDSGVIEESCDFLLGCWRHKDPDRANGEMDDRLSVAILKNRRGKAGKWIDLQFQPESRRVYEPAFQG